MKTLAALVLTLGLAITPLQGALAQEGGDDKGGEGGGEGSGEGSGGTDSGAAADPWKAPKAAEDKPADKPADAPADNSIVVPPDAYPKAELDRPLVLLPMVLEPRLWFFFDAYTKNIDNFVGMGLGADFGIIENLEAGISFPLSFAPKFRPGEFGIDATYELTDLIGVDGMWLGARLDMLIQTSHGYTYMGTSEFGMMLSTPFKYKFHDMVGMTAELDIGFAARNASYFWLGFEAGVLVQPIDWVAIELLFGLDGWIGDYTFLRIPLTLRSVFTPIAELDIFLDFGMPDLNFKNHAISADAFWIQIILGAAYRFGF